MHTDVMRAVQHGEAANKARESAICGGLDRQRPSGYASFFYQQYMQVVNLHAPNEPTMLCA